MNEYLENMKLRLTPKQYEVFLMEFNKMQINNYLQRQKQQLLNRRYTQIPFNQQILNHITRNQNLLQPILA